MPYCHGSPHSRVQTMSRSSAEKDSFQIGGWQLRLRSPWNRTIRPPGSSCTLRLSCRTCSNETVTTWINQNEVWMENAPRKYHKEILIFKVKYWAQIHIKKRDKLIVIVCYCWYLVMRTPTRPRPEVVTTCPRITVTRLKQKKWAPFQNQCSPFLQQPCSSMSAAEYPSSKAPIPRMVFERPGATRESCKKRQFIRVDCFPSFFLLFLELIVAHRLWESVCLFVACNWSQPKAKSELEDQISN